jgi:hypothetical protein
MDMSLRTMRLPPGRHASLRSRAKRRCRAGDMTGGERRATCKWLETLGVVSSSFINSLREIVANEGAGKALGTGMNVFITGGAAAGMMRAGGTLIPAPMPGTEFTPFRPLTNETEGTPVLVLEGEVETAPAGNCFEECSNSATAPCCLGSTPPPAV